MNIIVDGLVILITACYSLVHNYWIAIFLFTVLTKLILLPLSIMVQKNSIKTVRITPQINFMKAKYWGNKDIISEEQYKIFKKEKYSPFMDLIPLFIQLALLMGVVDAVKVGTTLHAVPVESGGVTLFVPLVAAISAFLMCVAQNRSNVLQSEQSKINKYGTMAFSIGLSLYLGFLVAIGVGFYWICSNLLSIVQLFLLNYFINPKNYIDYEALELSRKELEEAKGYALAAKRKKRDREEIQRERMDYKRFLAAGEVKLVFYSEGKGFYKYYQNIIEEIIRRTNIVVHYITSDPTDDVFSIRHEQFKTYYVGANKMIVLMMKMEADMVVMTTPDLENYQLKRSYVKKDTIYVYVPHDVNSANLSFHKNALDHFDVVFTSGYKNKRELLEREKKYQLTPKILVEWGSSLIDNMMVQYDSVQRHYAADGRKKILIAPSWQKDNIMDLCLEDMLEQLVKLGHQVIVRPHPQYVRHYEAKIDALEEKYHGGGVIFQKDFSSNETVYMADVLITDWSSIAFEYSFATLKPVLFINTPMKVLNPDYQELTEVPIDIELRNVVGKTIDICDLKGINDCVDELLYAPCFAKEEMEKLRNQYIYNVGSSGKVGAKFIINKLIEKENGR